MEPQRPVKIIDISLPVASGMVVYPGDVEVELVKLRRLEAGDPYNLTVIRMGAHAGTHLDAPSHYLPEGADVEEVPLDRLVGRARVLDWGDRTTIDLPELGNRDIKRGDRVIFKTSNSRSFPLEEFKKDYVYLSHAGAAYLREQEVVLVGLDYLSIEGYSAQIAGAHLELLGAGIPLLEGLDLSRAEEGEYWLVALPIRLAGAEGAPVRAILLECPVRP